MITGALGRHAPARGDRLNSGPGCRCSAPQTSMPDSWLDDTALYAGTASIRLTHVITAEQAVAELSTQAAA